MPDIQSPDGRDGRNRSLDVPLVLLTGGFIFAFCALALFDIDRLSIWIDAAFAFSARWFGLYWQVLLLATFLIGIGLCVMRGAGHKMGGLEVPEFSTFQWGAMIMCTLLGGGGVFWAAGEPIAHYLSTPPLFGDLSGDPDARAHAALAQAFLHWGFPGWAILGALATILLSHYHYDRALPLAPRTLLYPVFGDRVIHGPFGTLVDAACIIAVVAGTVGPIGFLGLQVSYGLDALFGIPDTFVTQAIVVMGLVAIYSISAVTGLSKGIRILSQFNIGLVFVLLVFMLVMGPTAAIFANFVGGFTTYMENFFAMSLFRGEAGAFGDSAWLGWWTIFFWGWFIGYGPLMAIFIARISRGRSIRSMILMLSIVAPIVTNFWFSIIGGSGIIFEQMDPGIISIPFEGLNLPAGLLAITQAFPFGTALSVAFLVLTVAFVATTGDSMSYVVAQSMSQGEPRAWLRAFWGIAMGIMAVILVSIGSGGVSKLQSFIVVTAVPVSLTLLPTLWDAPRIVWRLGRR